MFFDRAMCVFEIALLRQEKADVRQAGHGQCTR